jgi:hypothetical protein
MMNAESLVIAIKNVRLGRKNLSDRRAAKCDAINAGWLGKKDSKKLL